MEIPTNGEIIKAGGNANFGFDIIEAVKGGLLKVVCGYCTGYTMETILLELKLIKRSSKTLEVSATKLGRFVCYEWFARCDV